MMVLRLMTTTGLIGLLLAAVLAAPAGAHGGKLVYSGEVGPYYVEVSDRVLETGDGLLYSMVVRNRETELPVDGAEVTVTARSDNRTVGPRSATYFGNQYQVLIEDGGADAVEVSATIDARAGTTAFQHEIAGSGSGGAPVLASLLLAAGGVLALGVPFLRRRVRQSKDAR